MIKNTFIAKVGLFVVALPLFILIQAPSSAAFNEVQGGKGSATSLCGDKSGIFPDAIFARLTTDIGGSVSGFEIHASYDNGRCNSVLYATNTRESSFSNLQSRNDLIVELN